MADLQLTIDTQKAKADLSEALKEMRNMASNPIKVDLKLTAPKNTKDILRQFRELYELADRLDKKGIDIGSNINSGKGLKNEIKDVDKYYDRLIAARKKLNKAISTAVKDQKGNKPYLNTDELNRQLDEMRAIRNRMSKEISYIARNGTQHFNDKENTKAVDQMIANANRSKANHCKH